MVHQVIYKFVKIDSVYDRGYGQVESAKKEFFYNNVSEYLLQFPELDLQVVYISRLIGKATFSNHFIDCDVLLMVAYIFDKDGLSYLLRGYDLGIINFLLEILKDNEIHLSEGKQQFLNICEKFSLRDRVNIEIVTLKNDGV